MIKSVIIFGVIGGVIVGVVWGLISAFNDGRKEAIKRNKGLID
jgi:uncharacterized membrane protein